MSSSLLFSSLAWLLKLNCVFDNGWAFVCLNGQGSINTWSLQFLSGNSLWLMRAHWISFVVRENWALLLSLNCHSHNVSTLSCWRFWWTINIDELRMLILTKITLNCIGTRARCLVFNSSLRIGKTVWQILFDTVTLEITEQVLTRFWVVICWIVVARTWNTSSMSKLSIVKSLLTWTPCSCFRIFNGGKLIYTKLIHLYALSIGSWPRSIFLQIDLQWFIHVCWSALNIKFFTFFAYMIYCAIILAWSRNIRIATLLSLGKVYFLVSMSANTKGV